MLSLASSLSMPFINSQFVTLLTIIFTITRPTIALTNENCTCYVTSGPSPTYFLHHAFYDFRNIPSISHNSFTKIPVPSNASFGDSPQQVTSDYFNSPAFNQSWEIQGYTQDASVDHPVPATNSAQNVYILRDNAGSPTHLTLRTHRLPNFQSISEIDTRFVFQYASIRTRARIHGSNGAVAGIFTFADDINESDIEILTRDDPSKWRATNQPGLDTSGNEIPGASTIETFPAQGSRGEWNEWRLDWLSYTTQWIVNGVSVTNKTYGIPRLQSKFILNMWGDGGSWSGAMQVGDQAMMDVEWVELVYNVSVTNSSLDTGCKVVCAVDGGVTGVPTVVSGAGNMQAGLWITAGVALVILGGGWI